MISKLEYRQYICRIVTVFCITLCLWEISAFYSFTVLLPEIDYLMHLQLVLLPHVCQNFANIFWDISKQFLWQLQIYLHLATSLNQPCKKPSIEIVNMQRKRENKAEMAFVRKGHQELETETEKKGHQEGSGVSRPPVVSLVCHQ